MAQHGIVEAESVFQFRQHGLIGLDVQAQIVRLVQLVDLVSQLAAAPVFDTVYLALAGNNHAFVALQHGWNLFALIGMDQQNDFVMTHNTPLAEKKPPAASTDAVRQEKREL